MKKFLNSLIIINFILFLTTSFAKAVTYYSYRSSSLDYNSINSESDERLITWIIIIAGIYAWWKFTKRK